MENYIIKFSRVSKVGQIYKGLKQVKVKEENPDHACTVFMRRMRKSFPAYDFLIHSVKDSNGVTLRLLD